MMLQSSELTLVWYVEQLAMKSAEADLFRKLGHFAPKARKAFPL